MATSLFFYLLPNQTNTLVKRVVGIPGDHIHLRHGIVYRNGEALNESLCNAHRAIRHTIPERDDFPAIVPEIATPQWQESMQYNIYKVRTSSSRRTTTSPWATIATTVMTAGIGALFRAKISSDSRLEFIGRLPVMGVIMSKPELERDRLKSIAHTVIHFFDQTRWERTFNAVK